MKLKHKLFASLSRCFAALLVFCTALHAQSASEKANCAENENRLQGPFHLVDVPVATVFNILEELLKCPIIRSSALPQNANITFSCKKEIPSCDAVRIFRSILMLNGIVLIPIDNNKYYKAVSAAGVSSHVPEFLAGRARDLPSSQNFYTKFFELEHLRVSELQTKLKSSMSQNNAGSFEIFPKSNSFWVTDTLLNLQRIEEIIEKIDVPFAETTMHQVKSSSAVAIKDKLLSLKLDALIGASINADARTNKLIITASKCATKEIVRLADELDVESVPLLKSEVVYLKHGEVVKVADVLSKILSGRKSLKSAAENKMTPVNQGANNSESAGVKNPKDGVGAKEKSENRAANGSASKNGFAESEGVSDSGIEFSDYVQIVSEERSNAIVVYGTSSDLKQLKSIINKLDIVLMQVRIDVLITEVSLSDDHVSGLSSFGLSYNAAEYGGFSGSTKTYNLSSASNPAFYAAAGENSFSMLFDVARQNQEIKVLSSPTIVTTHNKEAEINISQSLPIITSSMSDITSISTTRSSVSYKDIGIKLLVTPLVGSNGSIQLKIDQSVDSISGYTTIDGNQQPVISKRKATSFVSAKSEEVIVLAGLQQVDAAEMKGAVWLLSDIFRPSKNEYKRRELIIFIRPRVVGSLAVNDILMDSDAKNSPAREQIESFYGTGKFYREGELEGKSKEFEKDRTHNKIINSLPL